MDNEFTADIVTLIDEEGNEHEFEILDILEQDDRVFYALIPFYENPEDLVEDTSVYYIFEQIEDENEELTLVEIEDEDFLDVIAEKFEERFDKIFDDEDETADNNE